MQKNLVAIIHFAFKSVVSSAEQNDDCQNGCASYKAPVVEWLI